MGRAADADVAFIEGDEDALFVVDQPGDRPFQPFRALRSPAAKALGDEALKLLLNYEAHCAPRQRKRRPEDHGRLVQIVHAVIADLMHRALTVPEGWVTVPLSKRVLSRQTRYGSPVLSKMLPTVLRYLSTPELEWVELNKGYRHPFDGYANRQSTMRAGLPLLRRIRAGGLTLADLGLDQGQETIILKAAKQGHWDNGDWLDYEDTETTRLYRAHMERINAALAAADVGYWGTSKKPVDEDDRFLRRIFNNGSFEQGGRLFGGFWQDLSKAERASGLVIQGEEIVTLDYAQMALRIVYGLAKVTPPAGDAYLIPGYELHRTGMKKLFNAMLFADEPLGRFPRGLRDLFPRRASLANAVGALTTAHAPIASLLTSGVGMKAMFIESRILVAVLLSLIEDGIPALPIHDALIVAKSKSTAAQERMLSIFNAHTGVQGAVNEE